jgi:hypothetical protein
MDADEGLGSADYGRLVTKDPAPEAAFETKQQLDQLCGAFGGLSETHHEILVLRELEGRSYKDIGERMGLSRPAVESTLFRARKRLGEEYDELASGARCLRIQAIIADAGGTRVGLRDQRRLARHISHCQPCRRLAAHAGLEIPVPARTRIAEKIAGLLPLPAFLRLRRGGEEAVAGGGGGDRWTAHVPMLAETLHSGWGKVAAGAVALVVAGAGAGVGTTLVDKRDERGTGYQPAAERSADPRGDAVTRAPSTPAVTRTAERRATRSARRPVASVQRKGSGKSGTSRTEGTGSRPQPASTAPAGAPGSDPDRPAGGDDGGGGNTERSRTPSVKTPSVDVPDVQVPAAGGGAGEKLQEAAANLDDTVEGAADNVGATVDHALDGVNDAVTDPQNLVPTVNGILETAVDDVNKTTNDAVADLNETVGGLLKP